MPAESPRALTSADAPEGMASETWAAWKTVLDDQSVFDGNPSATIRPGVPTHSQSSAVRTLLAHPDGRDELTFSDTLGTGGMGIVRLAQQRRMGRDVAVKSLRSDVNTPDAVEKLLAEGWITGALEHPNIVPVYDIAVDPDRRPHIVMKRISGIEWASVMDDADAVSERFGAHDLLSWNLSILQQVCNAVQYAHARDIVHRDLKPENVMIGAFGEVYVVDWGIAVTLDPDDARIPLATPGRVAGTPRYMAPEMVRAEAVDQRTDIYLLGGILHRILAGRPPHAGWAIREILEGIPSFTPDIPDAPEELVALVRDAMAPAPTDRPEGVEAFSTRIATYQEHRGSTRLSRQAHARLQELERALTGREVPDRQDVYAHLGGCRFGFREALEAWPDNPSARTGLDRALACVADYELSSGAPRAAAVLLDEMTSSPSAMRERIAALEDELRAEEARLERLRLDNDPSIGMRTRLFVVGVLGLLWTALPFAAWFSDAAMTSERQLIVAAVLLLLVGGAVFWARESFLSTPVNRLTAGILAMVPTTKGLIHSAFLLDPGASFRTSMVAEMVVYTTLAAFTTLAIDRRFWPSFLVFLAGTVVQINGSLYPMIPVGIGSATLFLNALLIWFPEMPEEPRYRE